MTCYRTVTHTHTHTMRTVLLRVRAWVPGAASLIFTETALRKIWPAARAGSGYEPCAPSDPAAKEMSLTYFADNGLADKVLPPRITMRDFEKVRCAILKKCAVPCVVLGVGFVASCMLCACPPCESA